MLSETSKRIAFIEYGVKEVEFQSCCVSKIQTGRNTLDPKLSASHANPTADSKQHSFNIWSPDFVIARHALAPRGDEQHRGRLVDLEQVWIPQVLRELCGEA